MSPGPTASGVPSASSATPVWRSPPAVLDIAEMHVIRFWQENATWQSYDYRRQNVKLDMLQNHVFSWKASSGRTLQDTIPISVSVTAYLRVAQPNVSWQVGVGLLAPAVPQVTGVVHSVPLPAGRHLAGTCRGDASAWDALHAASLAFWRAGGWHLRSRIARFCIRMCAT